ncbi:hypothetical protein RHGRI_004480 [Rhododendron griersonianum]|uniref:Secreted protein n=1 Tax=Rhododendron griersonianum TaxID=479676 RepID=A0AAV6LAM4_9ERIC|nr:hypothetical protein RHGRI_004480 [Rhododendron griersonianum]
MRLVIDLVPSLRFLLLLLHFLPPSKGLNKPFVIPQAVVVSPSKFSNDVDIGTPHNPEFPSYELFSNVLNCFPQGIGPVRWLCETYTTARNVSWISC